MTVLPVALLGVDAVLCRSEVTGPTGFGVALVVAAIVARSAWWIAGAVRPSDTSDTVRVRRRWSLVAIVSVYCGPFLFVQGTSAVNHASCHPAWSR